MVVGSWLQSPFGPFADVMIETTKGERLLLAPNDKVAEFVSQTYTFDRVELTPVTVEHRPDGFAVRAQGLRVDGDLGGPAPFDWLLRLVPAPVATAPAWLGTINPIAARLVSGVRTAGSAGNGRREYYGVRRTRRITAVHASFRGADLGRLTALEPPVRFGFSSAPTTPQMVSVTTTIVLP
ncbi:hypothetical protein [Mycobacterium deserti]|uniref:Uncharacterized protein n=1 Tax=Mycobacterium deserti TaxID=2978347 RepID=A0ABT2M606_9MYCO|nr:hypothetical protein [Mycobacterium deserti]MCT7657695.1 hypothetical protein [Mycobacterium deserti]